MRTKGIGLDLERPVGYQYSNNGKIRQPTVQSSAATAHDTWKCKACSARVSAGVAVWVASVPRTKEVTMRTSYNAAHSISTQVPVAGCIVINVLQCQKGHYRKRHAVTLSEAKGPGIHNGRRDASLRSA